MVKELEYFKVPRYVVFGPKAISKVEEIVERLRPDKVGLIITGQKYSKAYAESIMLNNCNLECIFEADVDEILRLKSRYEGNVHYIVCVGGGKVIDVGKVLAYLWDVPLISVPTVASHDGFASPYISYLLQLDLNRLGLGKIYKVPIAIIADTSIILEAPRRYLIAGVGELMGKIIAVKDWQLAHRLKGEDYSEYAATLSLASSKIIDKNFEKLKIHNEECVRVVVKALIGCGVAMSIAGTSRPCSGSEHLFSHALDLLAREYNLKPALHGEQVALGTLIMAYLHGLDWRKIKSRMKILGIPITAKELGYDRDIIIEALMMAHKIRPDRYTILGTDGLNRKAAEHVIDELGIA